MSTQGASFVFDDSFAYKRSATNDGNVSLSYSQNSAESTDSSMAGIIRALGNNDKSDEFILKKGGLPPKRLNSNHSLSGYSTVTEGESVLVGTDLLQTIAGQPSGEMDDDKPSVIELLKKTPQKVHSVPNTPGRTVDSSPSASVDTPTQAPPDSPPSSWLGNLSIRTRPKKKNKQQASPRKVKGEEILEEEEEVWYRRSCNRCFADDALDIFKGFSS